MKQEAINWQKLIVKKGKYSVLKMSRAKSENKLLLPYKGATKVSYCYLEIQKASFNIE